MKTRTFSAALLFLAFALASACAAQQFIDPTTFPSTISPQSVVTGDLNRDGNADLILGGYPQTGELPITVQLGNGDGTFRQGQTLGVAKQAISDLLLGDWNGDGVPDFVASNLSTGAIDIYMGVGDGTFTSGQTYKNLGRRPATGDLNGDGVADLVTFLSGNITILLGAGDGTFAKSASYPLTQRSIRSVGVGDFNNDGKADVIADSESMDGGDPLADVFPGNGNGTLQPPVEYSTIDSSFGDPSRVLAIADFNSDGNLDFAVVGGGLAVLLGKGDGTFAPTQIYAAWGGIGITVADVNDDGSPDLCYVGNSSVAVWRNNGDGTFRLPVFYGTGYTPETIVAADFNNDGHVDVVTGNSFDTNFTLIVNDGTGKLISRRNFDATVNGIVPSIATLALGYIDKDNNLDIAVNDSNGSRVIILPGNADGTFRQARAVPTPHRADGITLADVDGDGNTDLITVGSDAVTVLLGNGIGQFQHPVDYQAGPVPVTVTTADVNNDGFPDIIAGLYTGHGIGTLLNDGTGHFGKQIYLLTNFRAIGLAVGDLNKDGNLDVVTANTTGQGTGSSTILLGTGDGTFTVSETLKIKTFVGAVAVVDINADGNLDVVTLGDELRVYLGNGDGSFGTPTITSTSGGGKGVVGDFNHDGKLDAVISNLTTTGYTAFLFPGNGDGTFQTPQSYTASGEVQAAADVNHDGALDLVSAGFSCCVSVLLNTAAQ